ncbi:hypothetical protein GCM10018785_44970 [Streptomyces longispororuber]|uniref:Uncharacterized protein n=1 Tax=Streptomyces longispororuber TaxID=68230 RepID=A0A918ZW74_9ACTN|nr:hypothetical protein GCM10018785_44970 [Streptomyces longispororuber]
MDGGTVSESWGVTRPMVVVRPALLPLPAALGAASRPVRRFDPAAVPGIPAQCRISNKARGSGHGSRDST